MIKGAEVSPLGRDRPGEKFRRKEKQIIHERSVDRMGLGDMRGSQECRNMLMNKACLECTPQRFPNRLDF